jgi:hypothetical protein
MGAQMVREVASKTSDVAGDGTTTATVLAQLGQPRPKACSTRSLLEAQGMIRACHVGPSRFIAVLKSQPFEELRIQAWLAAMGRE